MHRSDAGLSVVVCTHNRPRDLERCLEALARLDDEPEIIVVDSASRPSCENLVARYARLVPNLRYVREEAPGLSRARNTGVAHATQGIVAFVDDDAAPRRDWSRRIAASFDDPSIGCVGGACAAAFEDEAARPRWLSDRLLQFAGITRFGSNAREARSSAEWPFGANIAFRAEVLRSERPFPEELGRCGTTLLSGEEYAVIEAVRAEGWKIWLEPNAIVDHAVHEERCRSRYYWRRLWWAGVSRSRAANSPARVGLRLIGALPIRLTLYALTRDRVYLYRSAETAGFLVEQTRLLRGSP
jgi:glucosyl-dolichyl phosphate glucuronosyltransferase